MGRWRIKIGGILLCEHHLDKIARFLNFEQDCPGDAVLNIVNEMRETLTIDWMSPRSPLDDCILVIVVHGRGPPGAIRVYTTLAPPRIFLPIYYFSGRQYRPS